MNDTISFAELKTAGVLPSPRGIALTVMKLCQTENVALPELAHTIQGDPVLAGRIIRIANLVNPNKSRPIASVSIDTLILIGIHAVRQVVLGFSLIAAYQKGACNAFDYPRYWSRSVAMASIAQALGALLRVAPPAEMFTCGLLAGVGQLGMASARPEAYSALLERHSQVHPLELSSAEIASFGMNHPALSAEMMMDWGIPRLYTEAVLVHAHPQDGNFAEGSRQHRLACTLQLAALLADAFLATGSEQAGLPPAAFDLAAGLDLEPSQLVCIANQTLVEWQEWSQLLGIETHATAPFADDTAEARAGMAPAANPSESAPVLRILLADADEAFVATVAQELVAAGHLVSLARSGRQAFEIAQREQPQVIVADWQTTESGAMLCRRLREQPWAAPLYFVMLGRQQDENWQIAALESGADACLGKPFPPRLLAAQLTAMQRRTSRPEAC